MTRELQHAMAQYEEARICYRKAVLASLNGESNGDAIREAIKSIQVARAELQRHDAAPAAQQGDAPREEPGPWSFMRRLLNVG